LIGRTLSHYRSTAAIGVVRMGVMYRASDAKLVLDVTLRAAH
jgi:hypothetical protein